MMARFLVGEHQREKYEKNCEAYDGVIQMFRELGSGKLNRRDVLDNIKTMVENGLIDKLEDIVDEIEEYEEY